MSVMDADSPLVAFAGGDISTGESEEGRLLRSDRMSWALRKRSRGAGCKETLGLMGCDFECIGFEESLEGGVW